MTTLKRLCQLVLLCNSLKSERSASCRFAARKSAELEVLDYITFYNFARLHSTLGYKSEQNH
ncbi:MAG: IS3 family transposase [Desulfobacterales bacterium]